MKDTEQAKAYLKRDPLRYMDMLQPLSGARRRSLPCGRTGAVVRGPRPAVPAGGGQPGAGQALCAGIETMRLPPPTTRHRRVPAPALRPGEVPALHPGGLPGRDPFPLPPGLDIRRLGEEYLPAVVEHYHAFSDPDYIRRRLAAGVMHGAFQNGELAGFIGMHAEGSVGMLEVFPPYRRRGHRRRAHGFPGQLGVGAGLGALLQIWEGNEASFALHRPPGLEPVPHAMYWVMDS